MRITYLLTQLLEIDLKRKKQLMETDENFRQRSSQRRSQTCEKQIKLKESGSRSGIAPRFLFVDDSSSQTGTSHDTVPMISLCSFDQRTQIGKDQSQVQSPYMVRGSSHQTEPPEFVRK